MVKVDPSRDYYADLELPASADINDIKKQFKKLGKHFETSRLNFTNIAADHWTCSFKMAP